MGVASRSSDGPSDFAAAARTLHLPSVSFLRLVTLQQASTRQRLRRNSPGLGHGANVAARRQPQTNGLMIGGFGWLVYRARCGKARVEPTKWWITEVKHRGVLGTREFKMALVRWRSGSGFTVGVLGVLGPTWMSVHSSSSCSSFPPERSDVPGSAAH